MVAALFDGDGAFPAGAFITAEKFAIVIRDVHGRASGYDATGNRTSLTTTAGTSTYSYPADSHHLVAVCGEARGHDAAGNTTSIGGKAFTYNDANRMNAVKQGNTVLESYAYNHRGERVLRTPAGGPAQITVYDEAGQWLGNYSATGQAQQQAIWLDNYPVARSMRLVPVFRSLLTSSPITWVRRAW